MSTLNLDRVTITGADDSVDVNDVLDLAREYPFLELGILLSKTQEGTPRFPTVSWIEELFIAEQDCMENFMRPLSICGHLCGSWVRDLCNGGAEFETTHHKIARKFDRAQLNFHGFKHHADEDKFANALMRWGRPSYIFQFDDVNNQAMATVRTMEPALKLYPLFDTSGGAGEYPESWPAAFGEYCGYAGGLHPDKIESQLEDIAKAAGDKKIWIDIETHVRSDNDFLFDLDKCDKFLSKVKPFVAQQ